MRQRRRDVVFILADVERWDCDARMQEVQRLIAGNPPAHVDLPTATVDGTRHRFCSDHCRRAVIAATETHLT